MESKEAGNDSKMSTSLRMQRILRLVAYTVSLCGFVLCGILITIVTGTKSIWKKALTRKKDVSKEVILITGGGSGLGRQIALELAKYKPKKIIIWGRNIQMLSETCNDILALGVECIYMACDVSDTSKIDEQLWNTLPQDCFPADYNLVVFKSNTNKLLSWIVPKSEIVQCEHGPVTMLINNAGVVFPGRLLELKDENIEKIFTVNLLAQFRTLRAFLPSMQENRHGHIITIGSCLGLMGINQTCAYASSKFGLTAYAESLSYMIDSKNYPGINTTVIYPFQINNKMFAGCSSRFPWMFPPVDEKDTAVKTVNAILTNTISLIIPRHICIVYALHTFLPQEVDFLIGEFCGMPTAMENFQGHSIKPKLEELHVPIKECEHS